VSKATSIPLAKVAAKAMVGIRLNEQNVLEIPVPDYFSVKESVFPFSKFPDADPILGPEMKSTGEVMGTGRSFSEAYAKAQLASGVTLPSFGQALLSVRDRDKKAAAKLAGIMIERGFDICATDGTARYLAEKGIKCRRVNKVREGRPHIVDMIKNGEITFIANTTEGKQAIRESHSIRAAAVQKKVTYYTTLAAAIATCLALDHLEGGEVNKLQTLHKEVAA
jgi:carbamoyl-phosphate synthase large subunit